MSPRKVSKRGKTSQVWNYFTEQTKSTAQCNFCSKMISYKGGSICNLTRHLSLVHPTTIPITPSSDRLIPAPTPQSSENQGIYVFISADDQGIVLPSVDVNTDTLPSQPQHQTHIIQPPSLIPKIRPKAMKVRTKAKRHINSYFQKPLTERKHQEISFTLIETIVKDYLPFQLVESPHFKKLISMLYANYQLPTAKTISNVLLPQIYNLTKEKVTNSLKGTTAVTLTTDSWTSRNENYMSLTAHFITDKMELKSYFLGCFKYDLNHTALNLANEMKQIAHEWDVDNKVVAVVSDNTDNVVTAIHLNEWKHIPCFAHNLNLIVEHGLQEIVDMQNKVKSVVEFFKRNPQACEKLKDMQKQLGEPILNLKQDVVTLWNSTYDMFHRIIQVKNALMITIGINYPEQDSITNEDITVIKEVCELLKVFKDCTEEMCNEKQITASKIILLSQALKKWCKGFTDDQSKHVLVTQMGVKLLEALEEHFHQIEENELFAEATALDPRFKCHGFADEQHFEKIKMALVAQVSEKTMTESAENPSTTSSTLQDVKPVTSIVWEDFDKSVKNPDPKAAGIIEVNKYMEEPLLARNGNPRSWWFERRQVYPMLFEMSKKTLCLVATSVPSERIFLKTGQLITERRNRLSGKKVSEILFLNGNL